MSIRLPRTPVPFLTPRARRAAVTVGACSAALLAGACASSGGPPPPESPVPAPVTVATVRNPLLDPDTALEHRAAPDTFDVRFVTTRGPFTVRFIRAWAPRGADRLYYLVTNGFYDGARFFRVLPHFVVQFGAPADPRVNKVWENRVIRDDPVHRSNMRGFVTFATAGPNTRTTQLFVNLANNQRLDKLGFAPLGRVIDGMSNVDSLYSGYGEGAPSGNGPDQDRIAAEGNRYLTADFPKLDAIDSARVVRMALAIPPVDPPSARTAAADSAKAAAPKSPARSTRSRTRAARPNPARTGT